MPSEEAVAPPHRGDARQHRAIQYVSAEVAEPPAEPAPQVAQVRKLHPLLRQRWVRRLLRSLGLRKQGPVPTCLGITRLGQPCRGPAMANGFCRLHGGSRIGIIAAKTQSALGRIFQRAHSAADAG